MKVRVAYIEEPPFYWTAIDRSATGADIELANAVLVAMGVSSIEYILTSFEEFLPGVQNGRWDMNVPIFITAERQKQVTFSDPVWELSDGFIVHHGNPKNLDSYKIVAANGEARLGLIPGQVQVEAAKSAGVRDDQMKFYKDQPAAIAAILAGEIDAFASTAVGSRLLASSHKELEAIAFENSTGKALIGGFSFNQNNKRLIAAVNEQLRIYLGSADHRACMAKYGITSAEIDGAIKAGAS